MKVTKSKTDLIAQMQEQFEKLSILCQIYDTGTKHIAQDIATKLRVLLHQPLKLNSNTRSLLYQLKLEHILFADTASKDQPGNILDFFGLLQVDIYSNRIVYEPILRNNGIYTFIPFEEWWQNEVISLKENLDSSIDESRNLFTRKKIVLTVAETDGGAHVDASLDQMYYSLKTNSAYGWSIGDKQGNLRDAELINPIYPSVRQIAEEVLLTFELKDLLVESKLP